MSAPDRLDWTAACRRLGLRETAIVAEIKHRFRELARKYHPDTFLTPLDRSIATKRFQPIAEAYSFLLRSARQHRVEGAASPPTTAYAATTFDFERPSDTVSMWALFDGLEDRHPWLYLLLELLLMPSVLYAAFTFWPLIIGGALWDRYPRVRHVAVTICLRWAPIALTLFIGYAGVATGRLWAAIFLFSGATSAVLEVASQVLAATRARASKAGLQTILAEAHALERAV